MLQTCTQDNVIFNGSTLKSSSLVHGCHQLKIWPSNDRLIMYGKEQAQTNAIKNWMSCAMIKQDMQVEHTKN